MKIFLLNRLYNIRLVWTFGSVQATKKVKLTLINNLCVFSNRKTKKIDKGKKQKRQSAQYPEQQEADRRQTTKQREEISTY